MTTQDFPEDYGLGGFHRNVYIVDAAIGGEKGVFLFILHQIVES